MSSGQAETGAIVPRWEWRTWGAWFGPAEDAFAALTPGAIQESDELYLLSAAGDNVKVRDDLMDIKVLREVDRDGLERWEPVMKAGFPLPAAEVGKVLESLRIPDRHLDRAEYTLDQFVREFIEPSGTLRAVPVHKRRVRYTLGGCMSELSEISSNDRTTRTIAIESTDQAAVVAAIRGAGLGGYVNTSFGRGLQALIDDEPQRFATIDVGTNSIKFHVGARRSDGTWTTLADRAEITRLGEGLSESGSISAEAIDRAATAIAGMVEEAQRAGVTAIAAAGTAGLRIAANSEAVVDAIRERTGVTIEVVDGEEESRLAYLAVKAGLGLAEERLAIFDTGGGSTQLTFGHGARVDDRFSVEVGAVRYTEQFGLAGVTSTDSLAAARSAIADDLSRLDDPPRVDVLVGMGGAVTNITAVKLGLATYDPDAVQGTVLDAADIDRQIELYRSRDAEARRAIVGLQPKRADVILAGACIVATIMAKLDIDHLTVSDRGLRHGLLIDRFEPAQDKEGSDGNDSKA